MAKDIPVYRENERLKHYKVKILCSAKCAASVMFFTIHIEDVSAWTQTTFKQCFPFNSGQFSAPPMCITRAAPGLCSAASRIAHRTRILFTLQSFAWLRTKQQPCAARLVVSSGNMLTDEGRIENRYTIEQNKREIPFSAASPFPCCFELWSAAWIWPQEHCSAFASIRQYI